jgi:hypothetical protein
MVVKRDLDNVYFRVMRDGKETDLCWTDIIWEERIEIARKNNTEGWLIRMIQLMNNVVWKIHESYPEVDIKPIKFLQEKVNSKRWLRNALFKITCEIRMAADEHDIVAERE